ncbi:acyl-CoA dehydrogenase family protein [Rhodocaloribacter litoris]|uniref:acyl-CoA dehydrogenase family protein n=1 Tax=Rhodocaloribacter litoris TaxID=2558931 RepID=UPI0014234DFC|nr:acyl-CoA dehydrogenase family protein [Rhodocaloribacter litoris]QXD14935.1 acyl-CoA dehydrogenase family protein [Rhodocaloribacter litoris]
MDFNLSEEQRVLRNEIIRFARKNLNAGVIERDRSQTFPRDLWLKCGEMGLQGLPVPERYGGVGLDPLSTAIALEAFGYGCEDGGLAFSICAHLLACVIPVWKHGSEAQKEKYLPGLTSGTLIAVNAMSEPGSGSDAYAMKTRAVREGNGYRINGTKIWSTNGPVADLAVVYAVTDPEKGYYGGISVFLVEKDTPGFAPGQKFEKMGLRTSPIGEIVLEDVWVPEEAMLGGPGAGTLIFTQSMEWERVCIGAMHCGTMHRLLDKVVAYARTREAFGQKIGKYQAVSHKIVDMKIRLEAARLLAYKAATRLDKARDVAVDASVTKVFVSEALLQTALDAVQIYGGNGFMTEYEVERVLRDAVGGKIYSGTNEIQRNMLAKWLGL